MLGQHPNEQGVPRRREQSGTGKSCTDELVLCRPTLLLTHHTSPLIHPPTHHDLLLLPHRHLRHRSNDLKSRNGGGWGGCTHPRMNKGDCLKVIESSHNTSVCECNKHEARLRCRDGGNRRERTLGNICAPEAVGRLFYEILARLNVPFAHEKCAPDVHAVSLPQAVYLQERTKSQKLDFACDGGREGASERGPQFTGSGWSRRWLPSSCSCKSCFGSIVDC